LSFSFSFSLVCRLIGNGKENRKDNKVENASNGSQDKKDDGVVGVKVTTVLRLA